MYIYFTIILKFILLTKLQIFCIHVNDFIYQVQSLFQFLKVGKMALKIYLSLIKFQLKILKILSCFPFEFDDANNLLLVSESLFTRWYRRLLHFSQWVYLCVMFIQCVVFRSTAVAVRPWRASL